METKLNTHTDTCSECSHWKAISEDKGECRRQPPQAITFKVGDEVQFETRFPETSTSDWCGEFKAS